MLVSLDNMYSADEWTCLLFSYSYPTTICYGIRAWTARIPARLANLQGPAVSPTAFSCLSFYISFKSSASPNFGGNLSDLKLIERVAELPKKDLQKRSKFFWAKLSVKSPKRLDWPVWCAYKLWCYTEIGLLMV